MINSTVVTHFYNEEFLLPFWIKHHRSRFLNGIFIDYGSTDNSVDIIKEFAPNWSIVKSRNSNFSATEVDNEINEIESKIRGRRIVLTVTEFFIGDPLLLDINYSVVPTVELVCNLNEIDFDTHNSFCNQISSGLPNDTPNPFRIKFKGRVFHDGYLKDSDTKFQYTSGRHYLGENDSPFLIYRVQNCLVSEKMIDRRLQIQHRIPRKDVERNYGFQHHFHGQGLTRDIVISETKVLKSMSTNVGGLIQKAKRLEAKTITQLDYN
jgi:hypothetical protein